MTKWAKVVHFGGKWVNFLKMLSSGHTYVGEFRHAMDSKKRLTIPARWRFEGDTAEVTYLALPNPGGFITVYPPEKIAQIRENILQRMSMGDADAQKTLMYLSSKAHSFGCDKQGRINLNDALIKHASIEKDTILLGNFVTFSIWNPKRYDDYMNNLTSDSDSFAQTLSRFGL